MTQHSNRKVRPKNFMADDSKTLASRSAQTSTKRSSGLQKETSWESVGKWYQKSVGKEGHYYHQTIVLPGILRLLAEGEMPKSLLDVGCGQGVLARRLPPSVDYLGIDLSEHLLKEAKRQDVNKRHAYACHDMTQSLSSTVTQGKLFDAAAFVLSLQNVEAQGHAIKHAASHIAIGGRLLLILNHPCFRIPRQSSWQIDEQKQCRFRRLERYLSPLSVPIQMQPSLKEASAVTWSFHYPLSAYMGWLKENGFMLTALEEWCSDKQSTGKYAKMENRSREEFPLFLALVATKCKESSSIEKVSAEGAHDLEGSHQLPQKRKSLSDKPEKRARKHPVRDR